MVKKQEEVKEVSEETTETTEDAERSTPLEVGDEVAEKSIAEQTVPLAAEEEDTEKSGEEPELSSEETEEEPEKADELQEFLSEEPEEDKSNLTPGAQRRIDRLTAEKRALEEKLAARGPTTTDDTPKYTESQLTNAVNKGIQDGDAQLIMDVFNYKLKQQEKSLEDRYKGEQTRLQQQAVQAQGEWAQVVKDYSYLSDKEQPEIYEGSRRDFSLASSSSLLYRLAISLYNNPENNSVYRVTGGQRRAVSDALALILKRKRGSKGKDSKETKILKKRLAKAKRKTSLGTGVKPGAESEGTPRTLTDNERLASYIQERKEQQEKATEAYSI